MKTRYIGNVTVRLFEAERGCFEAWVSVYGDVVCHLEGIVLKAHHREREEPARVDRAAIEAIVACSYGKEVNTFVRNCLQTETNIAYQEGSYAVRRTFNGEERFFNEPQQR